MDDSAQSPVQPASSAQVQQPQVVSQPPASVPQPLGNTQGQQPASAVVGGKEHEAATMGGVQPSHPEVIIPEAVAEVGVTSEQSTDHEVRLTPEQQAAGLEPAKEATPVPKEPGKVQLPEDYQVPKGFALLHQHVHKAVTWLWLLLFKEKQMSVHHAQDKEETKQ